MAAGVLDGTVLAVGNQFRPLVDAHPPAGVHSLLLGVIVPTAALRVLALYLPVPAGVGNNMMFFSRHGNPFS